MTLIELATQVECAQVPDRELDRLIWQATAPNDYAMWEGKERGILNRDWSEERRQVTLKARGRMRAEPYTLSLDAAMTLRPDGWGFEIKDHGHIGWLNACCCYTHATKVERGIWYRVEAATPALALTAASLRARAA